MATASTVLVSTRRGFFEKTIINLLSAMPYGRLEVTFPDGETQTFGNGEGSVSAHIRINNTDFFKRVILYGDIGFGEAYVDGDWDTDNITHVLKWFMLNIEKTPGVSGSRVKSLGLNLLKLINKVSHLKNSNTISGSRKNIAAHYDLNNDFFSLFLDATMTYSSAYFVREGMTLEQAQEAKYERLCRQLNLQSKDHVLEIGSGWGGNAIYMAKNYGCRVTTLTISQEQFNLAQDRIKSEGLSDKITVLMQDYRTMTGVFDKIVSIEMIEAVGHEFLQGYFKKCNELLKKNGLLAIQAITCPDSRYDSLRKGVDWIQKHIFPGSLLPSVGAMNKAVNKTGDLTLVDLKDLGLDYAATLSEWRKQFARNWQEINKIGFDEAFARKWNYYLCYCEAAFAMRNINVMQLVYARPNTTSR
ncbi:methyltransferase domain-containing protein [Emticicia sp. CRIBPO]|uniref:SAM-dependent methyltransferase n=1 Tax=Emticicia sp. CRIBPO TaxID=2683258 RepID=UPI0014128B7D|nr:cyclopropane-fatty-acyl-phospholipid synthase family protein [Emticicia sp. CRIBPO]NBA85666.1 methyltransferase domain-containing protein [Emticicia sp. CRIBPO]